jgi:hypothetical protein
MTRLRRLRQRAASSRPLRILFAVLFWLIPVAFVLWLFSFHSFAL